MSASTAKATRREIRRAVGAQALGVITHHEEFLRRQSVGNQTFDERLTKMAEVQLQDRLDHQAALDHLAKYLDAHVEDLSRWQRLRWVLKL